MLRYGIVGCGHIARKHTAAIEAVKEAKLVAVCDTNPERLTPFAKNGIRGFTDLTEMLQMDVDVVCICTPNGLHAPLAIRAAEAKKHVIVEKPMALTLVETDQMIEACAQNGVKLAVVHPNRFRPAVLALRNHVDRQAFGKISHANATVRWNRNQAYYDQAPWRGTKAMDGGVLMNQAIHNMDLLLWMIGDIEEVSSYHATHIPHIEAEDTSVSIIRFQNGALGVVEAAVTIYPKNLEESLSIFGEKGTAIIGGPTANWIKEWKFDHLSSEEVDIIKNRIERNPFGIPGHQCMIQDMTDAIHKDRAPIISGEEGREAVAFVIACQQSAEWGKPVRMETLKRKR
jgi:UDP-N-acetyl-2-amino-2-deoxyglucuronate dehydrogenase